MSNYSGIKISMMNFILKNCNLNMENFISKELSIHLIQVLVNGTHDLLTEPIIDVLHRIAIVNYQRFANDILLYLIGETEKVLNSNHQGDIQELKKNYFCSFKKTINSENLLKKNYKLIINTDYSNPLTKKLFHRQFRKNYKSFAYTSIIKHKKLKNNIATQIFTSKGPLAFLPLSKTETSIVYSFSGNEKIDFKQCVKKYNNRYEILSFRDISSFKLISSDLRSYFNKNVLAFGDLLHKIHPLAGQGFNMSLRDTREILNLIMLKKENGLDLDYSICIDFEKKTRHKNLIFSNSIDFIYEYFNFENKVKKNFLSKAVKYLGKNNKINKILTNVADNGFMI